MVVMVDSLSARASVAAATGARTRAPVNVDGREHRPTAGRLCQAAVTARMNNIARTGANKKMQSQQGVGAEQERVQQPRSPNHSSPRLLA
eukprot:scaffold90639_cov66-Phaeocystis_antarctica.AAC.5